MKYKTYKITTIGCQMNKSDSERIAGYLESLGFLPFITGGKPDIAVFTTCGVRQSAEDRIYGLIPKLKKENPKTKIILTGCLSLRPDVRKRLEKHVDIWMPVSELPILAGKLGIKKKPARIKNYLNLLPKYNSSFSAFIPIGNGCDNFCAYCVVPYARGREVYRPAKEIVGEAGKLIKKGYKEIILIAQNVNSYSSGNTDFADLLKSINDIEGEFWVRFSTSHPKDMGNKLISTVAECEKVCRHIHLPAQAGDNEILKKMNRKYTVEHYIELIDKIRKRIPNASITTDIIVGFPGETRSRFANTKKLFRKAKFDMAYIARYSPRPGTSAYKMYDDVVPAEKKKREEELMGILKKTALNNNKKYLDKKVRVLIEKKDRSGIFYGHTDTNKNVRIAGAHNAVLGGFTEVRIEKASDFGLEGRIENKKSR